MALTNKDVDQLAGDRNVSNTDTVDWKEGLKPKRGGFFDPALTGGHGGNRWAAIKLHEPMPNPAFEEPIRRMLGLTQKKFEEVIAGRESVGEFGKGPQQQSSKHWKTLICVRKFNVPKQK
jgi:DNA-directed RNA polymerase beta' subunit